MFEGKSDREQIQKAKCSGVARFEFIETVENSMIQIRVLSESIC